MMAEKEQWRNKKCMNESNKNSDKRYITYIKKFSTLHKFWDAEERIDEIKDGLIEIVNCWSYRGKERRINRALDIFRTLSRKTT